MTPLERAAQAARQAEDDRLCGILGPWSQATDETREAWVGIARAVLAAIREPSDAMLLKGGESGPWDSYAAPDDKDNARDVWSSMIDAMLEEG